MALTFVLVALCLSFLQLSDGTPAKPVLSESFSAKLTALTAGQEISYELYRDYEGGKLLEVESLGAGKTVDGTVNFILDVKTKKVYQYFEPYGYCASFTVPSAKLYAFWDFVKEAKYKGSATFNQKKVDIWASKDIKTNTYIELGVSSDNPKVPVFLFNDQNGYEYNVITFEDYTSGPPDATKFDVPAICKTNLESAWFHRDPPARNYTGISAFERLVPKFNV